MKVHTSKYIPAGSNVSCYDFLMEKDHIKDKVVTPIFRSPMGDHTWVSQSRSEVIRFKSYEGKPLLYYVPRLFLVILMNSDLQTQKF